MMEFVPSRKKGRTYEATYLGWLNFFKILAYAPQRARVPHAPLCWHPLIRYMGHVPVSGEQWFLEDSLFRWPEATSHSSQARRIIEVSSTCRPELVHALYLWDTEWRFSPESQLRLRSIQEEPSHEFVVTCNASFFRAEVMGYLSALHRWKATSEYLRQPLVICPCAADKPYPAPLHKAISKALPSDSAYLIVATGVLGLVPQDLWGIAPNYDAGLPFNERVYLETCQFFADHPHSQPVIVYSDFLAFWLCKALQASGQRYLSVLGERTMPEYCDLASADNLRLLKETYASVFAERRTGQRDTHALGSEKAPRTRPRPRSRNRKV